MSYETALKALKYGLDEYLNILKTDPVATPETSSTEEADLEYAVFQFLISDVFTDVKRRTATLGKFLKDPKTGERSIDDVAITDDEVDIFNSFCKSASVMIFDSMTAYTKKILTAFLFDEGPTITVYSAITAYTVDSYVSYDSKYYICIQAGTGKTPDTETEYWTIQPDYIDTLNKISIMISFPVTNNTNTLSILDKLLLDCHVFYIMGEWFEQIGLFDLAQNWKAKYQENLDKLKWNLTKSKGQIKITPSFP
jgi:hypothetical protein